MKMVREKARPEKRGGEGDEMRVEWRKTKY